MTALASTRIDALLMDTHLPVAETRMLLEHVTGWSRTQMIAHPEWTLSAEQLAAFQALHGARMRGEPMAYLLGEREFYGRRFQVDSHVLIPRPETELLIDTTLLLLCQQPQAQVLDLGTGSGAIAITLALEAPEATVLATDYSTEALAVAKNNAQRLQASVQFFQGDWWQALAAMPTPMRFDVVVSNPPYVAQDDIHLAQGDVRFEPRHALTDFADGLQALRHIIFGAPAYLQKNAWLWLEHGYDQAQAVRALLTQAGFTAVQSHADLAGIARISGGQFR